MITGSRIYFVSYDDFIEKSKRFSLLSINLHYRVVPEECHCQNLLVQPDKVCYYFIELH